MKLTARLMVVAVALMTTACATRAPVYMPGADVTAPVLVTERQPDYTEEAMNAKIQGTVLLNCVVLPDGIHSRGPTSRPRLACRGTPAGPVPNHRDRC